MLWLRETAGWLLLGTGVAAFAVCYFALLLRAYSIEAAILAFIAFTVFRGGLHLLKVAMAAKAVRDLPPEPAAPARTPAAGRKR